MSILIMTPQAEFQFQRPCKTDADVADFMDYLRGRGWTTARSIHIGIGWSDRQLREWAELSEGKIISGQRGYKLTAEATPKEIYQAASWLKAQGKKMLRRSIAIRRNGISQIVQPSTQQPQP